MKTVLLTDDNEDMIELIKLVLAKSGYRLVTASDGDEAVRMAMEIHPDLVLMDLKMPKMDGLAATRALRAGGYDKPIVVLTASEDKEDRRRAEAAGCNAYLVKTLEMRDVENILDRFLADVGGI